MAGKITSESLSDLAESGHSSSRLPRFIPSILIPTTGSRAGTYFIFAGRLHKIAVNGDWIRALFRGRTRRRFQARRTAEAPFAPNPAGN